MFFSSHVKEDGIKDALKENYLIGIEKPLLNGSIVLKLLSKDEEYIFKEAYKVNSDVLKTLQDKRRYDSLYYLESGTTPVIDSLLNDIYLYEIDDPNVRQTATMEFYAEGDYNVLKYYVSKDLLRTNEETKFLEDLVERYFVNKRIDAIDNNVVDFKALQDKEVMSYDTDIALTDKNDYARLLHISGKNICPALMKYIKSIEKERKASIKKGK